MKKCGGGASNATGHTFIGERRVFMGQRSSLKGNGRHRTVRELRRVFRIWLMETEQGIIKHRGTGTHTHTDTVGGGVARWVVRGPQCSRPQSQAKVKLDRKRDPQMDRWDPMARPGDKSLTFCQSKSQVVFALLLLFVSRRRWECVGSCDGLCNGSWSNSHALDRRTINHL